MRRGKLIALEGIDGSGTTSQAEWLTGRLRERGVRAHATAEPSTGPVGLVIRRVLGGELPMDSGGLALLFAADRLDHLRRDILPELEQGVVVVSDRYLLSSLAYQSVDQPLEWVRLINARALRPDLSILLRVSPETAAERRSIRGGSPELFDALERQREIAAAYERAFLLEEVGPTRVVDAEQAFADVSEQLSHHVDRLLAGIGEVG